MTTSKTIHLPGKDNFIVIDDMIVEARSHAIVERIKDIDDSLEVLCVDPSTCTFSEAPFVLAEIRPTPNGLRAFKVFEFWELNDSVVERVHLADSKKHDILQMIDDNNSRLRDELQRSHRDKMESKKDLVAHIIADTKSKYSYYDEDRDAKVTIYEDGRLPKVEKKT